MTASIVSEAYYLEQLFSHLSFLETEKIKFSFSERTESGRTFIIIE